VHAALEGVLVRNLTEARGLVEGAAKPGGAEGALGPWAVDALDRLLGSWLPRVAVFAEAHSRRVADLDEALRAARAEADHAHDAAASATANRAEVDLALLQARHAASELEEERVRSAEWQRRLMELHSELEATRAGAAGAGALEAKGLDEADAAVADVAAAAEAEAAEAAEVCEAAAAAEAELRHEAELQSARDQGDRDREACVGLQRQLAAA